MNDPWKVHIDAARAAGEPYAWVPDYGGSGSLYQRVEVPLEPSDPGRFEPSPYDFGITGEPDMPWLLFNGHPVMETASGRLMYDCAPDSERGVLMEVPQPDEAEAGS